MCKTGERVNDDVRFERTSVNRILRDKGLLVLALKLGGTLVLDHLTVHQVEST